MSTHGPDNGNGQSLDKGLKDISQAYGKLGQEQPPELLDQAILNKARREVEARPRWTQFGWPHGLTTAAVFVLAFSLVLNQRETAPVEENIELELGPVKLQAEPVAEDADHRPAPAVRQEYRRREKSARGGAAQDAFEAEPAMEELTGLREAVEEEAGVLEVSTPAAPIPAVADSELVGRDVVAKKVQQDHLANEDAEQRLAEILRLKQAGDPAWETALQAFVEEYPDYPLPAELSD
jgi:hypothetical protein